MPTIKVDTTSQRYDGNAQPKPQILLLHTTETASWPGYRGGLDAPHVTVKPLRGAGIEVRVHRPWSDYGKSLENRPGGVETNRRGVLQVELMGTCDPASKSGGYFWPSADDVVLEALADYLRPVLAGFGIPAVAIAPFLPYPKSYGSKGGQRLTFAQWNVARGICGHQHAPENDHGDPGAFPIARFIEFLKEDDMPSAEEIADAVWSRTIGKDINGTPRTTGWAQGAILRDGQHQNAVLAALKAPDVEAIASAVAAALPSSNLTAEDVAKALVVELVKTSTEGGPQ